jgi:hypothetical protein
LSTESQADCSAYGSPLYYHLPKKDDFFILLKMATSRPIPYTEKTLFLLFLPSLSRH